MGLFKKIEFYEFYRALWIVLSESINISRNLHTKRYFFVPPWEFYPRFMLKVPSTDHSLLTLNMPFKMIVLKEVWGCFLMSGMRILPFSKDWMKFIQIHQYYPILSYECFAQEQIFLMRADLKLQWRFVNCYCDIWITDCTHEREKRLLRVCSLAFQSGEKKSGSFKCVLLTMPDCYFIY